MLYGHPRPGAAVWNGVTAVQEPGFEPSINDIVRQLDDALSPTFRVVGVAPDRIRVRDLETGREFSRDPERLALIGVALAEDHPFLTNPNPPPALSHSPLA